MNTYLKWLNPAVAILIFLWCAWIYFGDAVIAVAWHGEDFTLRIVKDLLKPKESSFTMYFFIKGVFCSVMLFLVGEYFRREWFGRRP